MNRLKSSRTASFIAVVLIYILAAVVGIVIYASLPFHFAINLLIADVTATVFVFIFSLIFKNASVYDPYWSVQPPVIASALAIAYGVNPLGVLLLIAIWFWAVRLTANWAYTFSGLNHQDWRYTMLSEKCGKFYPVINFIGIHLVPTLVVYACTLPAAFAIVEAWEFTPFSLVFSLLAVFSALMQGVADIQMHKFKKSKMGGFIDTGLWKYSRHPNYLGEILQWWCVALAVAASAHALPILTGALLNTLLFLLVSIPMADGKQSKKDGWAEYKGKTRMLLPLPKHR